MKHNTLFQCCILFTLTSIITVTAVSTTAQKSARPAFNVYTDTAKKYSLNSFSVLVQPEANDLKFVLSISNPFGEHLKIAVTGNESSGFSDTTNELTYQKRINLTGAEDGTYTIIVSSDKKTITRTITITTTGYNRNLSLQ